MNEPDDLALLRDYAANGSEAAFGELVTRRVDFVYSAALRQTRDPHRAEEITQAVFILLARKAGKISGKTILAGWLFKATRYTALAQTHAEMKRSMRTATIEKELQMRAEIQPAATDDLWPQMSPLLDEALAALGETDRQAVLLRFFENRSLAEVGQRLGLGEDAARKRIGRALKKLHRHFSRRGVRSTTAIIAGAVSANSVQAAPMGLAQAVSALAAAQGAAATASTLTLIQGALKIMAWTKMKIGIATAVVILLAAGTIAASSKWNSKSAVRFVAEGTVTYATAPDPRGSFTDTKHFIVMRDGATWKIRTITEKQEGTGATSPSGDSVDLYYEMGFDGTNLFRFIQQDKNKILSTVPQDERSKWVFAEGDVQKADAPSANDTHCLYPVWLAYCSAPYFKKLSGDQAVAPIFAPGDFIGEPIQKKQMPAKWKLHGRSFMKEVSWYSDGTVKGIMPDGKEIVRKYPPPYDVPFVQGQFEALSWTNWNGISLPSHFTITVYRPDYNSRAKAKFVAIYTITGAIDKIHETENVSAVPEITTRTHITDWRSISISPARYVGTNWRDVGDDLRR